MASFKFENPFHLFNVVKKLLANNDLMLTKESAVYEDISNLCELFFHLGSGREREITQLELGLRNPIDVLTWNASKVDHDSLEDFLLKMSTVHSRYEHIFITNSAIYGIVHDYKRKKINNHMIARQLEIGVGEVEALLNMKKYTSDDFPDLFFGNLPFEDDLLVRGNLGDKKTTKKFQETMSELKYKAGVYFLYNSSKKVIYIGKSRDLGSRIPTSAREKEAKYYSYALTNSYSDAGIYEMYYIAIMKPKLNVDGKFPDEPTIKLPDLKMADINAIFNGKGRTIYAKT